MTNTAALKTSEPASPMLLRAVDGLIAALVFVLPFIMGGREAWGHWFLISTAFLLGATWCLYATVSGSRYAFSWLEYFFLAGLGIAWFQVQPQTVSALDQFSPEYTRLLAFWPQTQPTDAHWSTLSLTPVETRHGFWVFVAYAIIGLVVFQRAKTITDCERLMKWVGLSGVAMTIFGLWQWGLSNGRFFWFYEHPYTNTDVHLKGAFTNRNHFAQFLSLSVGPLLWWLVRDTKKILDGTATPSNYVFGSAKKKSKKTSRRRELPPVKAQEPNIINSTVALPVIGLLIAVCLVGFGVVLSLSRGGMIAVGAVSLISILGLWRGLKTGMGAVGVVVAGSVLFLSLLSFTDQEELQTKLDQLISSDADKIDTGGVRRAIWTADAKIIRQFPLLGTGVGSHRDVYPLYMDNYADHAMAEMTHAESSFVHVALETGLIGFGTLALALLFVLGRMIIGSFRTSGTKHMCTVVVLACCLGGILHGVVDFIWYAPAIVVTSLVLLAVGLRTSSRNFDLQTSAQISAQPAQQQGLWFPRLGWAALGGFCVLGLVSVQGDLFQRIEGEKHWYASLRTKMDPLYETEESEEQDEESTVLVDESVFGFQQEIEGEEIEDPAMIAKRIAAQKKFLIQRIQHMSASLKAWPNQHRVQQAMADQTIRLFDILQIDSDNPFSLSMLRDASSTGFGSVEELHKWLNNNCSQRVNLLVTANKLARQSLSGCPLLGYAYLNLMQTTFVEGHLGLAANDCMSQALLVRGHDPRIRLAAGKEALVAGRQERALELFQTVFHSNQRFRLEIIQQWASNARAEFFLHQFKPNGEELEDLLAVYDYLKREQDSATVLRKIMVVLPEEAPAVEDEDERLEVMMKAFGAAHRLEELEPAVQILETAIEEFPFAFDPRYLLGRTLVELERGAEAMEHLNWCYNQDPSHIHLQTLIAHATKLQYAIPEETSPRLSRL